MSISLTPAQEELIQIQLQTGRFNSAEEVLQTALQLLAASSPASAQKRLHITPAAHGSGYTNTAIDHDRVLANLDSDKPA